MKQPLKQCQQSLAVLWLAGSAVLFGLVFLQTTMGHFGDNASAAWSWLLPSILPTASLIVTALFKTSSADTKTVDRFLFRLAFLLSLFYLGTAVMVLLLQPLTATSPTDALTHSNVYLGPFQGLVASSFGAFFGQTETRSSEQQLPST
jgi:hypothetical protein